jgi:hypothetical protein
MAKKNSAKQANGRNISWKLQKFGRRIDCTSYKMGLVRRNKMKRYVLSMMLAIMFVPALAVAQEEGPENFEFQMEMQEREMELEYRNAEMDLERRMQELELEKRKIELEHMRRPKEQPGHMKNHDDDDNDDDGLHPLLLLVLVVHILCAVWVYQDIRRRAGGSGIWIVIALLTGLLGTLVYAVVRLGENQKSSA